MSTKDFGMLRHIVPITAPAQKTATFVTPNVAMKKYERVQFLVLLGTLATDSFTLTVTASRHRRNDRDGANVQVPPQCCCWH